MTSPAAVPGSDTPDGITDKSPGLSGDGAWRCGAGGIHRTRLVLRSLSVPQGLSNVGCIGICIPEGGWPQLSPPDRDVRAGKLARRSNARSAKQPVLVVNEP